MIVLLSRNPSSSELCSRTWNLMAQQLRFRNRPNLKRPLPVHFNKARMNYVCIPVYPPKPKNCQLDALIDKNKSDNPSGDNPYAVFLAGKLRRDLEKHPLVCIFHTNSYTQHELINIRGSLYDMKYQMDIQEQINSNVVRMALSGTRWSPLTHIMQSKTALGFCADDNIPKLMKALKKMPQFVLLAVVSHGRILHRDAIKELENFRDITNVRTQLCSTLSLQSVTLSQNLTSNINALSNSLTSYSKQGEDTSSSSSSDSDSDSSSSDSDKE